jgi:hypothetical protein
MQHAADSRRPEGRRRRVRSGLEKPLLGEAQNFRAGDDALGCNRDARRIARRARAGSMALREASMKPSYLILGLALLAGCTPSIYMVKPGEDSIKCGDHLADGIGHIKMAFDYRCIKDARAQGYVCANPDVREACRTPL